MLSIAECRELLGPTPELTDEDVQQLRDHLYGLADIALTHYFQERDRRPRERMNRSATGQRAQRLVA